MPAKSHTLFHFTRSSGTLKSILKNGFWPRYCLEDIKWIEDEDNEFVAYPMVCFCDIPLSRVEEHVGFYGEFGLGLTKEWALKNGMTPVHYISQTSELPKSYNTLVDLLGESDKKDQGWEVLRFMLAHTKPLEGRMSVSGELINKEFHQESEWRYIARNENIHDTIVGNDYKTQEFIEGRNNETKRFCMLKFLPSDIKYIFVRNDSDIPEIIKFIQSELGGYPLNDVLLLISRVTSLESIRNDV
ncbi:hypothetical protein G8770_10290 [Aestuariicella hydrocarbonica]|uniref:Abortive phage resistance protein AbiGi, antitoxin n=1 Tax=Pseudomaricurvus hydrocarbonicus TaxID=1470433 RepID=A0A9E5MMB8_9GAMM|nr:abortive infection system antitoxin AbiGi family protein [Aestuariicella hydrocarbonica]NHO65930.1 hypothetical protein [Aestuariicella hydrocarbonica]